jgi:hypothetical protein
MCEPPDTPEMQRAARQGDPNCKTEFMKPDQDSETTQDIQAGFLRQQFAIGISLAAALAPLIWGMPR